MFMNETMEKEMFEMHDMASTSARSSSSAPRKPSKKKSSLYVWSGGALKGYDNIFKLFFKRHWMRKVEEIEVMLILEKQTSPESLHRWKSEL